jgi:PIN domain nuclease of toxin-antitoxin system
MKLLLDTHTVLWIFNEHERLTNKAKALVLDDTNTLYVS